MAQSRPPEHARLPPTIQVVRPQMDRTLNVRSPAIGRDGWIDARYSARGDDVSPPLNWSGVPDAQSYAVVVEDPDAPGDEPFVHWMVWDLPGTLTELPQGLEKTPQLTRGLSGAVQGVNDMGEHGWFGPKPPAGHGVHHYHFQVFALSVKLNLPPETKLKTLANALKGVTLASGEVVGLFETRDRGVIRPSDTDHAEEGFAGKPGDEPRGAAADPPRT